MYNVLYIYIYMEVGIIGKRLKTQKGVDDKVMKANILLDLNPAVVGGGPMELVVGTNPERRMERVGQNGGTTTSIIEVKNKIDQMELSAPTPVPTRGSKMTIRGAEETAIAANIGDICHRMETEERPVRLGMIKHMKRNITWIHGAILVSMIGEN